MSKEPVSRYYGSGRFEQAAAAALCASISWTPAFILSAASSPPTDSARGAATDHTRAWPITYTVDLRALPPTAPTRRLRKGFCDVRCGSVRVVWAYIHT